MKLSVPERFAMLNLLPQAGSFVILKLMRVFREALSFDDDEVERFEIKHEADRVTWNKSQVADKEIEIGSAIRGVIVETLTKLDETGRLTDAHVSLYEKFLLPDQE